MFATENSIRWSVASEFNGLTRAEAKARGWTLKREGRFRRYYDATGKLVEAYSYNTCIAALEAPTDDFAEGRYVLNMTVYSMTSTRHQNTVLAELQGDWLATWAFIGLYDSARYLTTVLRQARDVYGVSENTDASELRALGLETSANHFRAQLLEQRERKADKAAARKAKFKLYLVRAS